MPPNVKRLVQFLATAMIACDPVNEIHVEPESRADSLVLHAFRSPDSATGGTRLSRLSVAACDTTRSPPPDTWVLERDSRSFFRRPPSPVFFRYGQSTPGWHASRPASVLREGCYVASVEGAAIGGATRFWVGPAGEIR
jgi:hypothetical protein